MKTKIKTIHEEEYSNGSRILGVLSNYSLNNDWNDSLIYIFDPENTTYIFFKTMIDTIDYLLYGEKNMKRAYLSETEFDKLYDNDIDGKFTDILVWG